MKERTTEPISGERSNVKLANGLNRALAELASGRQTTRAEIVRQTHTRAVGIGTRYNYASSPSSRSDFSSTENWLGRLSSTASHSMA